jgi:hypothetical protein
MSRTIERLFIQTDADAVEQFIDRLSTFRRDDWTAVASVAGQNATARSTAYAILEALVAHHGLGLQAWNVADDVETAVFYSLGLGGYTPSRGVVSQLRTARDAAGAAALALLVRALLTVADFETLYRPFAALGAPSM